MTSDRGDATAPDSESDADRRRQVRQGASEKPRFLERVTPPEDAAPTGEVPAELLDRIIDDLVAGTGGARSAVRVERAESVLWNDGSLGCPEPGKVYTQAQVRGYRVVLALDDRKWDYRATEGGYFMLCERLSLRPGRP